MGDTTSGVDREALADLVDVGNNQVKIGFPGFSLGWHWLHNQASLVVLDPKPLVHLMRAAPKKKREREREKKITPEVLHAFLCSTMNSQPLAKRKSRTSRAGLVFPVGRVRRYMKKRHLCDRVSAGAPIFLAAVLEYLTTEVMELAGNAARDNMKTRIHPRHVLLAVRNDEELNKLLCGVAIPEAGVIPQIHAILLPKLKDAKI